MNSFNTYFRKYFDYNSNDERELLTQIYQHRNTGELCQVITLLKHAVFNCKIHINTVVFGDKILLLMSVLHLEDVPSETVKQLVRDIKKNIKSPNLKVVSECLSSNDYNSRRCVEFVPCVPTCEHIGPRTPGLEGWL